MGDPHNIYLFLQHKEIYYLKLIINKLKYQKKKFILNFLLTLQILFVSHKWKTKRVYTANARNCEIEPEKYDDLVFGVPCYLCIFLHQVPYC